MMHSILFRLIASVALAASLIINLHCPGKKDTQDIREIQSKRPIPQDHRIPGEYLVKLTSPDRHFIQTYFNTFKVEFIKPIGGQPNVFHIKVHPDPGPEYMKREAVKEQRIEYIEPNLIFQLK